MYVTDMSLLGPTRSKIINKIFYVEYTAGVAPSPETRTGRARRIGVRTRLRIGLLEWLVVVCLPSVAPAQSASLEHLLRGEPAVVSLASVRLPTAHDGWTGTGVEVEEGQGVTLFGFGEDVGARVWVRIGRADIENLGGESYSFLAWATGEIEVISLPRDVRWEHCDGTPPASLSAAPRQAPGHDLLTVAWRSAPGDALGGLVAHEVLARAKADLDAARELPAGFRSVCYLLRTADVFEAWDDGERHGVWGNAASSGGIIKKAVDLPLDRSSEISFAWRYDDLHSLGPETEASHHDYSSIALEFDNGQDITWMRSPYLEAVTSFRCPLPWWDRRETHIVLQSGREDVGVWQSHTRKILDDYEMAVGGDPPERVVGVWFISVGVFGGTTADTKYVDVVLRSGGRELEVFE